ncbi:hypothetical protein HMI54_008112 [Coelomomyces lativittatus]|nr:hypothetical protein HMI56_002940 [Coelomomyces lativittatus]KAJ1503399.1 hypothetical protein HMI54_008112 [Coelomomyces lativittatus]KAJ1513349.1 hypothetical protein HMI55_005669 [Coelomomyces lativittatus]
MATPAFFSEDHSEVPHPMFYIQSLSIPVKRRLNALRKIEMERDRIQAEFNREVLELEKKYVKRFSPLYKKRAQIVTGEVEPTDSECKVPSHVLDFTNMSYEKEDEQEMTSDGSEVGVPGFWATCLKNHPEISQSITSEDWPALQALQDIKVSYPENQLGFTLEFVFGPNDYFTNSILTKTYYLKEPEDEDGEDFVFDYAQGTPIQWKEGKDLSVTMDVRKQRNKNTSQVRIVKRTVPTPTFFNFFSPISVDDSDDNLSPEEAAELDQAMTEDYQLGADIKENIVPHPLLWYTGEANDMDEFDEDEEDEDDDDDDDDEDDDE